jgi:hypothetical protein
MRTHLSVLVVLAGLTMPAMAHSPMLQPEPDAQMRGGAGRALNLPGADDYLARNATAYNEDSSLLLGNRRTAYENEPRPIPSIHIGAFHLELGGNSQKTHFAHYSLDGVRVLGGGISGSIDGRSARIAIRWPAS